MKKHEKKECPFCGGRAELYVSANRSRRGYDAEGSFVYVQCIVCKAKTQSVHTDADYEDYQFDDEAAYIALNKWNTRR